LPTIVDLCIAPAFLVVMSVLLFGLGAIAAGEEARQKAYDACARHQRWQEPYILPAWARFALGFFAILYYECCFLWLFERKLRMV